MRHPLTGLATRRAHWRGIGRALSSDVRYAFRRWRYRPAFAATAVVTLALGIAATTSIFNVVDAVLLRPLPWKSPETLVVVHGVYPELRENPATAPSWNRGLLSTAGWQVLQSASSFANVAAWNYDAWGDITIDDTNEFVDVLYVSSRFLPVLGVNTVMGRGFTADEDHRLSDNILIGYELWQRQFGGRRDIIGRKVTLNVARFSEQSPKTVVGVVESGFRFDGHRADVFRPVARGSEGGSVRNPPSWRIVGRLTPGVSLATAGAQAAALVAAAPNTISGTARVVRLEDEQLGPSRRPLWLLFGGAAILLLIACSNVAGLLLGEARVRHHEFAVRAALGASRARVVRQLVVEQTMLAAAGAVVGLAAAGWLTGALVAMAPPGLPRIDAAAVNSRTAIFSVAAAAVAVLVFGTIPALTIARLPVRAALSHAGREGLTSRGTAQRLVVVGQIALALVLLTGAALFGETMLRLRGQPLGFDPDGVAVISTTFVGNRFGDPALLAAAWKKAGPDANFSVVIGPIQRAATNARTDAVLERLSAIPGVTSAAAADGVPFVGSPQRIDVTFEGWPPAERAEVLRSVVSRLYFSTMGMPVVAGRAFENADAAGPSVVVVSAEFERRFFPSGAVGRRFFYFRTVDPANELRVVGVVPDAKRRNLSDDTRAIFYTFDRQGGTPAEFVIKSAGDASALLPAARAAIAEVSPQIVVRTTATLDARVGDSIVEQRFRAMLSVMFGAAALVLAAVGLYGLAARRVADRRREFGVRVALGAQPRDLRRLVLLDAARLGMAGLVIGVPAAAVMAQVTRSLLFGVTATAPHVFGLTIVVLMTVVLLASVLPARRAGAADPVVSLRG